MPLIPDRVRMAGNPEVIRFERVHIGRQTGAAAQLPFAGRSPLADKTHWSTAVFASIRSVYTFGEALRERSAAAQTNL